MDTTGVNSLLITILSILIFILAMVGIGDIEFGPFSQETLFPF